MREARLKTGLSTSRVQVQACRRKPASTYKGRVKAPGIPRRCAGGAPGRRHRPGGEPCVEASRASAGGSQYPTRPSPRWCELAGFCFVRAAE